MVPVKGINRLLILRGLEVLNKKKNIGLSALINLLGIDALINAYHLGYYIGPCINAGGRVGDSKLGVNLLTSEDKVEASYIANKLNSYNDLRREIEEKVFKEANELLSSKDIKFKTGEVLLVAKEGWHPGVIGIVASRLVNKFRKPVLVISINGLDSKGSARSVEGFDIGKFIKRVKDLNIISNGG